MPHSTPSPIDPASARTPYRPLAWLAIAIGAGVAFDLQAETYGTPIGFAAWYALALAGWLAYVWAKRRASSDFAAGMLLLAAVGLGGAWHHWRWNFIEADDVMRFAREEPQPTCVEVVLADGVEISPAADPTPLRAMPSRVVSEATVRVVGIRDGAVWRAAGGRSRLRIAGTWDGVAQGSRLQVFAKLGRPRPPLNPGEYDWAAAERRAGRLSELYCPHPACITVVDGASTGSPGAWLRWLRQWCERQLSSQISPQHAPLVLATLLGDQERISDETKEAFLQTGSIHLLVVSGMHVALLGGMVWGLAQLAGFSARTRLWGTIAAVALYAILVGPQPSVIRATILAIATMIALASGRSASAGNILGAAAVAVIAYNPCELFRAGTQLSFLSVAAMIGFTRISRRERRVDPLSRLIAASRPRIQRWLRSWARACATMLIASLAIGTAVAPLVAHHFNIVTPASVLLTPLAGPLVTIALYAGAMLLIAGWLLSPLAALLGAACGESLHLAEQIVIRASEMPGSHYHCAGFGAMWLVALYGAAGLAALLPRWRPSRSWLTAFAAVWFTLGYASLNARHRESGQLRCTFVAVGHGACAVLELPNGQTILYDAGSLGSPDAACRTIAAYLWSRGIGRIDAIVVSHADIDHYNAIPGLVERFPVGVVYVSPMMFDPIATLGNLDGPNYLRQALDASGVAIRETWMGDRLNVGDTRVAIDVLFPPRGGVPGRDNANSLVLCVEYAGRRVLLPGDLESPGIELVMADPPHDCDVLLAPHHGSEKSDPPGFAAWCTPEYVVMSSGEAQRTVRSTHSYETVGASVFHTAASGAVWFTIDENGLNCGSYRELSGGGVGY